ncbi:MAG: YlxR family protein [Gaiellales bacterium]
MTGPIRTCVGCGRKAPQEELLRFGAVASSPHHPPPDGATTYALTHDPERRLPGRGAYTCRRLACFERAASRRAFARTLRRTVVIPSALNALYERR